MDRRTGFLSLVILLLCLLGTASGTHVVFDGAYQNGWSGIGTTSFGGETVLNLSGSTAWFWKNCTNSSAKDLSVETTWYYEIYCDSSGGGDKIEWHVCAPNGYEWDSTYKFAGACTIDGNARTLPQTLSTDTWHTVSFDMSAKSWWDSAKSTIRYLKWQYEEPGTYYVRNVRFTGGNGPPVVDAGSNDSIELPDDDVSLDGTVSDDGLPDPPGSVSVTWTKQSGDGTVSFGNANAVDTTATFSTDGVYVLRLTASDSALQAYDEVTITVNPQPGSGPTVSNIATNEGDYTGGDIPKWKKLEITFDVDTSASNLQLPYDSSPPSGVQPNIGVSVDVEFTPDNWTTTYSQPAFYYKSYTYELKNNRDWMYPDGQDTWMVRFAPNQTGAWKYRIKARDTSGLYTTSDGTFDVVSSSEKGFIKVSDDARYFEFENGDFFEGLGYNLTWGTISFNNPVKDNTTLFDTLNGYGINLCRTWLSHWGISGSAWYEWSSPLVSEHSQYIPSPSMSMNYYYGNNDVSMRIYWTGNPGMWVGHFTKNPPLKTNTNYAVFIRYYIPTALAGPRIGGNPYGLCLKTATGWLGDGSDIYAYCDPGTGTVVSNYAYGATGSWQTLTGSFSSGSNNYVGGASGYVIVCLENITATGGTAAYIDQIQICEDLGGGQYGPNILGIGDFACHQHFDQKKSYAFDRTVELADTYDIYLKLVLMEKNEWILQRFDYDGVSVPSSPSNNNFYGNWRTMTKSRWFEQAFWRYSQARWGYSPHIHSWEILNEGDPWSGLHYTLTDEFGNYMHQFTANKHVATTSNWNSFPKNEFWANSSYPDVDYADYHEYPTSYNDIAAKIESYNNNYGAYMSGGAGKPMVLGETGYGSVINNDTGGIWYHNYIWAGTHHGGVYQQYWCENNEFGTGYDERAHNKPYKNFIEDIPLNNGHYQALSPTINGNNIRVFGQKDLTNKNAHLWIQNNQHTWYNIVNSNPIGSVTGTIEISGFTPSATYDLEWWDPYESVKANQIITSTQVNANGSGVITLSVSSLVDDIAAKIFATTEDTTPPTPNPSTWATQPYATGSTSISMTATTASDPSGVQYYFDCTAGAGGHDSGWQSGSTYQDTGLSPSTQYSYRVQTRDQSSNQNTGSWSTTQSATTDPAADTTPPTPNPLTWATQPYAAGPTSVSMAATTASDPSGVEYYFDCTAGAGGHDSGWQDSTSYTDTGLSELTQYTYRVQARDKSTNQNTGGWSTSQAATTQDGTAPTPNPSTWATVPYATGSTSISMTATTASDPSGVQYYFDCTAGAGGHDSGWQSSATYQDTGLNPSTQYSYRVQTRDQSANQNTGSWSTTQSATTDAAPDTTPPTPNPLTWATVPYATGTTSISMTATTASDPSGVEYYFDCTAGGGHDSGWQDSTTYQDTGLSPSTQYTYRVQARDKSANQNTGGWSTSESATTDAQPDTTPPTPDPLTWSSVPAATGSSSIEMTATTASDPSGVEYYFDCTAGGGNDSGWQDSATYEDTGLDPETQYTYRVQARDKSANQNTGGWSSAESATTNAAGGSPVPVFGNEQFYSPWYGTTGTGNIPFDVSTCPDAGSTVSAWAERTNAGWTEIRASGSANIGDREFLEFDCYWDTDSMPGTTIGAFHMEVNGDGGWTFKWEGSSVCWIDDNQQTFSPNPTFSGKTWQHFKLDLDTNIQGGTWPTDPNIGVIRMYFANANGSSMYINNAEFTGGSSAPDTDPPTPDPMTFATAPYAAGPTSVSMVATTASDASGVEYYFDCTAGAGGHDSGWQDSTSYTDTGLSELTQYTYRVQARDKSANQNATAWSTGQSATTQDGTAPTPNPSTWATQPYATGSTSISMTATTASDPSGVQYYFDCTAGAGGHDSGWQSSATYQDTGLTPSTQYSYRVQTRDQSSNQNTGSWSTTQSATTSGGGPVTLLTDGFESNFDKWTDGGATDWDRATSQKYSGSYSAHCGSTQNDLISDNLNSSGYSSIYISFWYRDDDIDDGDNIYLQLYNGSSYVNKFELGITSPEDTWHFYETTIYNSGGDTVYFRSNFRIKFEGSSIDSGENLWIDDVLVTAQ